MKKRQRRVPEDIFNGDIRKILKFTKFTEFTVNLPKFFSVKYQKKMYVNFTYLVGNFKGILKNLPKMSLRK